MPDDTNDRRVYECCGESLDPFEVLVSDLMVAAEGHEEHIVVDALCHILGGILADYEPEQRKLMCSVLSLMIAFHTEAAGEVTPARLH